MTFEQRFSAGEHFWVTCAACGTMLQARHVTPGTQLCHDCAKSKSQDDE